MNRCECGLEPERFTDWEHDSWHHVITWNRRIFERAEEERRKKFDAKLQADGRGKSRKKMPDLWR